MRLNGKLPAIVAAAFGLLLVGTNVQGVVEAKNAQVTASTATQRVKLGRRYPADSHCQCFCVNRLGQLFALLFAQFFGIPQTGEHTSFDKFFRQRDRTGYQRTGPTTTSDFVYPYRNHADYCKPHTVMCEIIENCAHKKPRVSRGFVIGKVT